MFAKSELIDRIRILIYRSEVTCNKKLGILTLDAQYEEKVIAEIKKTLIIVLQRVKQ